MLAFKDVTFLETGNKLDEDNGRSKKYKPRPEAEQIAVMKLLLTGWSKLEMLSLDNFSGLFECAAELASFGDKIKVVELESCEVDKRVGDVLAGFRNLYAITLWHCGITDAMVQKICSSVRN